MDWKVILTSFSAVFLAELGDKTQLAVLTLTASTRKPLSVGIGAGTALLAVTAVGVLVGQAAAHLVPETVVRRVASVLFVAVGVWMWFKP